MSDVGTWLAEIGLGQYADAFEANDVVHFARSTTPARKGFFVIFTGTDVAPNCAYKARC
jgi:hypothetical protein